MSSNDFENRSEPVRPSGDRLLTALKVDGPQTTADLGKALGTTGENARQQLLKLAMEGLVEVQSVAQGVGRPSQLWRLAPAAQARFPDSHAELTVSLIKQVRDVLGPAALDHLIAAREAEMLAGYQSGMADANNLEARLDALAAIRTREGYMAQWQRAADGEAWLFIENHCPICAAAATCQGFCRSELAIFQAVLGPDCKVERTEHILHGARRCAYRVVGRQD